MGDNKRDDWSKRVIFFNNLIRKDKEALKWWEDNKEKLKDTTLEYPINETLPLMETPSIHEERIMPCIKLKSLYDAQRNGYFYDCIMEMVWGDKVLILPEESEFIVNYFEKKLSLRKLEKLTGKSKDYYFRMLKKIEKKARDYVNTIHIDKA